MRHFPKFMILFVIGFIAIVTVFTHQFQSYRYNDITKTMNEATKTAVLKGLNPSVRVTEGKIALSQTVFEDNFKKQFQKSNIRLTVKQYKFDYRQTNDGHLAFKVKITDDEDTEYQTTYVTDLVN
jgi:hypothetical protein